MKILHVIRSADPVGGGPIEGVCRISSEIILRGHVVDIACLDPAGSEFSHMLPTTCFCLGSKKDTKYGHSSRMADWLNENIARYDLVIVNGLWQFHGLAVRKASRKHNVPYVVFTHGMLDPWFKRAYPLKHFKKWLYWPWAEYRVLRDASSVLFTCEEECVLARESFWLYKCNEVVVGYGTSSPVGDPDSQREKFVSLCPQLRDQRFLLFLGRIHEKKGCDLLIEAFADASRNDAELKLVIAGPDQCGWKSKLVSLATKLGIDDKVLWPGMLTGDAKWGAFYAAEAFVLPSHQENFGIAVAEAMACGLPVLISDKVNIWREIQADSAGLVGPDTIDGTVAVLSQWIAMSKRGRVAMGHSARESFLKRFEISKVVDSLEASYLSIIGAK